MSTSKSSNSSSDESSSRSNSIGSIELSKNSRPPSGEGLTSSNEPSSGPSVDLIQFNERPSGMRSKTLAQLENEIDPFNLTGIVESGPSQRQETIKVPETRDEAINATTPTMDHMVQTSRRTTLNMFECKYGYHFATSPTSSMISELAREVQKSNQDKSPKKTRQIGYGKSKLVIPSSEDEQLERLTEMFPTATKQVIEHMIKIYQGREGLIKAALISIGYKRSNEYSNRQTTAQSPIMLMMAKPGSKKLFDKLSGYFPEKDEALIKELMYRHKEVEHEIISALVETDATREPQRLQTDRNLRSMRLDRDGVIMKLRYLKSLFPSCDETELYHMLHLNDLNAQIVIGMVEARGHKRVDIDEVIKNRKSQTQKMRTQQQAMAAKDKTPGVDPMEAHRNRTKPNVSQTQANNLKDNLKKSFDILPDGLLLKALESTDYNEQLARMFLDQMGPIDEQRYEQRYEIRKEERPDVIRLPCKGTQKDDSDSVFMTVNEYLTIPTELVESKNAVALLKTDACTFTEDDFERVKFTHRIGRSESLSKGSSYANLEPRQSLRRGAAKDLREGSRYQSICNDSSRVKPNARASGQNKELQKGADPTLARGHNPSLIKHIHPFFLKLKTSQYPSALSID